MNYSELITDSNVFSVLCDECDFIFDTSKRLPERVFRNNFAECYAFEHGMIMHKDFAIFLTVIAHRFGDRVVNYMTIAPDPVNYYFKNCAFYGAASFEPSTLIDNYLKVMARDGEADSFRARGGDVAVMWGSSLRWGIFCDRISWELCVVGSFSAIDQSVLKMVKQDTFQVSSYELSLYRDRPHVAEEFSRVLTKNYPTLT